MTETPERPELLPCPFDGCRAEYDAYDGRAWCPDCGVMYEGRNAIANWNRRASSLGEPVSQEAPVISSASPLSEDEARAIESLRHLTMGQKAGRVDYVGSLNLRDAKILYDLLTKD